MMTTKDKPLGLMAAKALESILNQTTQKGFDFICCICGKPIVLSDNSPLRLENSANLKCPSCIANREAAETERRKAVAQDRKAKLLENIPPVFRATVRDRLPHPEKLDLALRWKFGPKGLLLHGPTGCGKSRIIWELAKREILAGKKIRNLNAHELSRYPSLFAISSDAAVKFGDELIACDLLILDDVFKTKATERVEELLFCVIDERGAWERPCLVSLNDTGETLKERLSSDRGPALIRRLRDYCTMIQFDSVALDKVPDYNSR